LVIAQECTILFRCHAKLDFHELVNCQEMFNNAAIAVCRCD